MKKYICKKHNTELKIDDQGNRSITIDYDQLSCKLPDLKEVEEKNIADCKIKEVEVNA